ncbi:MaoC/PaaZ C-terminal domain-containing protein [Thermodesulfobacteriota bacterium]
MEPKFFEDVEVGDKGVTAGRTITEADVVAFAGLSGDYNPIHTDAEFCKGTMFKQRIAHGALVYSISSGLFTQCEMNLSIKTNLMALMGINWRFLKAVFFGDTVHVEVEIIEKKETSKADRGIIIQKRSVVNQHGDTVQEGEVTLMMRRK